MYPVIELAKYIVVKCISDGYPISNLQLQKILYYIQKDFLIKKGQVAFTENIEAWTFGPVVPVVYYCFCGAGSMPITLCNSQNVKISLSLEDKKDIDSLIERKRLLNPWDLVAETHKTGGAWASVYNGGHGNHLVIPVEKIKSLG